MSVTAIICLSCLSYLLQNGKEMTPQELAKKGGKFASVRGNFQYKDGAKGKWLVLCPWMHDLVRHL